MAEGSKTEKATPKKRRDERKKGNTFLSQDAVAVATLTAAICTLFLLARAMTAQMGEFVAYCLAACGSPAGGTEVLREIAQQASWILAKTVLPMTLVTGFCAVAVTLAQTKFLVSGELLRPKFSRISPKQGIKRLFSLKSVIDALKGIVKITLLLVIVYLSLKAQFLESAKYLYTDIEAACRHLFESGKSMAVSIIIAFVVIAAQMCIRDSAGRAGKHEAIIFNFGETWCPPGRPRASRWEIGEVTAHDCFDKEKQGTVCGESSADRVH